MQKKSLLFLLLICSFHSFTQRSSIEYLQQHIRYLAADSLKGRATGSNEEKLVNDYIINNLRLSKKTAIRRIEYKFLKDSIPYRSEMVSCFVNNKSKYTVLITAHSDHIGLGSNLSLSHKNDEIHNGADDNASGVALVLELQKLLNNQKLKVNLLFVFYTGHELGLYGSSFFSQHLPKKCKNIVLNLNFDMVGRMDNSLKKIFVSASPSLIGSFNAVFTTCNLIEANDERLLSLDCSHFHERGVPSATFTTGIHNDYHKVTDDEKYINYEGIEILLNAINTWMLSSYNGDN